VCSTIRGIFSHLDIINLCIDLRLSSFYLCYLSCHNFWLQDLKKYKLRDPSSFHYLNQSACIKVDGINDAEEYLATRNAMDTVGITGQEQVSNSSSFHSEKNYPFNVYRKCCTLSNSFFAPNGMACFVGSYIPDCGCCASSWRH
jgi:hypothetical protein